MKKLLLIFNFSFFIFNSSFAQPAIQWQKCLGGTGDDKAYSVQQTSDGGYIVAGYTRSSDGDVTGFHYYNDYWVVKIDSGGAIQWQKCLGGTSTDDAYSAQQTSDGGYIVAGYTQSNDGDVTGNHGGYDCWVVKLDGSGNFQWQKCLGGTSDDMAYSIQQTTDGGYFLAGETQSYNGDVIGNHGVFDYWVVKLDGSGNIQWQKCLGGSVGDYGYSARQTAEGGYIVAGSTYSYDGDVTGNHDTTGNLSDYWVVKLDVGGNIQWQKCLGGTSLEESPDVQQTADGGYIVAGGTRSNDGDVTGNHGNVDYWVVKLDSSGNIQWQKCLGGTDDDIALSIKQTADGGSIAVGYALSNDGDVTSNHSLGSADGWLVKMDASENIQWQKCLGGTFGDAEYSVQQTVDGGFIVAGTTQSTDGDVTGLHGGNTDYWIVKLSPFVGIEEENNSSTFNITPNPITTQATISFSKQVHNATFSLYNLLGKEVAEATGINGESFEFNRGNLQSGVYVFEVMEKETSVIRGKAVLY